MRLSFIVDNGEVSKNIFWKLEKIQISDMHHQAHVYFGLLIIGNIVNRVLPNLLVLSDLQKLTKNAQEVQNFYDRVCSDIIAK